MVQELFFQISSMVLIMSGMFFKPKRELDIKYHYPALALLAWMIVEFFINDRMGYAVLTNFVLGLGVYATVARHADKSNIKMIYKTLVYVAVFSIIYLAFQYMGWDMRGQGVKDQAGIAPLCSIFGIENVFGAYVAVVIPCLMVFLGWIGSVFIIPVIFAKSTGAILGGTLGILFFLWFRKRIFFWIMIIPILAGSFLFVIKIDNPMGMQKTRLNMWGKVIQDSFSKPLGHGLDSFRNDQREGSIKYFKYPYSNESLRIVREKDNLKMEQVPDPKFYVWVQQFQKSNGDKIPLDFWDHPHNEYIWIFYELGIPGLAIFIWMVFGVWRRFSQSDKNMFAVCSMSMITILAIYSTVQFPLHLARIGCLMPVIFGMFYATTEHKFGTD
jgi:hypothetical protein